LTDQGAAALLVASDLFFLARRAGIMSTQVNGGLANGYLQRNNIATTAGLRFRF
jgi:hypothetical protein